MQDEMSYITIKQTLDGPLLNARGSTSDLVDLWLHLTAALSQKLDLPKAFFIETLEVLDVLSEIKRAAEQYGLAGEPVTNFTD